MDRSSQSHSRIGSVPFDSAFQRCAHQFFDAQWSPLPDQKGLIVEPGHQFEWAWLLLRWGEMFRNPRGVSAALRLIDIAQRHGVDATRGVAFNALDEHLIPRDLHAKLWPQTERIKALHAISRHSMVSEALSAQAAQDLPAAIEALQIYSWKSAGRPVARANVSRRRLCR